MHLYYILIMFTDVATGTRTGATGTFFKAYDEADALKDGHRQGKEHRGGDVLYHVIVTRVEKAMLRRAIAEIDDFAEDDEIQSVPSGTTSFAEWKRKIYEKNK